jgi:hypothetical protein
MLPTITKEEERAGLDILVAAYTAKGGKIIRKISRKMASLRKAQGLATPEEYERNARAQQAQDDVAYYHIAGARHAKPMYDSVRERLYGWTDNDRRQSKGPPAGTETQ